MASQPLKTIPEEPTPARVTADPPKTKPAKNPGRVESGKRLAERNRLAREAKKKAEAETASPAPTTTATSASEGSSSSSLSQTISPPIPSTAPARRVLPARGNHGKAQACPTSTTRTTRSSPHTGTVSHSSKTRHQRNGVISRSPLLL